MKIRVTIELEEDFTGDPVAVSISSREFRPNQSMTYVGGKIYPGKRSISLAWEVGEPAVLDVKRVKEEM